MSISKVPQPTDKTFSGEYPTVPEWVDLTNVSDRTNALMRANWELLNEAAALLNAGDMSPLAWEALQDIWVESIDLERKIARARDEEVG